jgi:hypothetical protein
MDSISNSGVSLILNPDIANAIDDNQHQHDLSTCEEEFENQEEIQQMLANAFDSQSLSNTDNDAHVFDDDEDEYEEQIPVQKYFHLPYWFNLFVFSFFLVHQSNMYHNHRNMFFCNKKIKLYDIDYLNML